MLALQRGAVIKTNPMDYGKHTPALTLAETFDNALVNAYSEFETSILPKVEEIQERAKKDKAEANLKVAEAVESSNSTAEGTEEK